MGYPSLPDFSVIDQVLAATQTRGETRMKCFLGTSDAVPKFMSIWGEHSKCYQQTPKDFVILPLLMFQSDAKS